MGRIKESDVEVYKKHPGDIIMWARAIKHGIGFYFSFDGEKWFNYYADYPDNLTKEQKAIFDRENEYLAKLRNGGLKENLKSPWT